LGRGRSERRAVKAPCVVNKAHEGHGARRVPGAGDHSGRVWGSAAGWWARCGVTGLVMVGGAVAHPAAIPEPAVRPFDTAQDRL